jgi:hypothetical protein
VDDEEKHPACNRVLLLGVSPCTFVTEGFMVQCELYESMLSDGEMDEMTRKRRGE